MAPIIDALQDIQTAGTGQGTVVPLCCVHARCQRRRDNNSLAVDDVTSPPPRELTNGCLPAKKGNKLTTPPAAPAKDDALQQAHTPPLTRGGVVAGKTDPAASPVVASQAPGQSAGEVEACRQPSHGIGRRGLAEMFNRRF